MKTGKTLTELAMEIERRAENKKDFVVGTKNLDMIALAIPVLSRFGLYNAITRLSQDVESYDRATELERIGAQVIELAKPDWKVLAEAA